jgi:pimeloyl-ACP methyl ester carboxylesterase|nr:alpha/beta fold hydrolase [Kofleriaceae bacterium]
MRHAALAVLLAAACGNDHAAPTSPGGADAGSGSDSAQLLQFTPCSPAPFECATLVVPADYAHPDGPTIALPVMRARARDQAHRIGALTFNFGGPGGATQQPIANEYPRQPVDSTTDLTQRFDFVLMDWRGVATSQPALTCLDDSTRPRLAAENFAPQTDGDWTALFQLVSDVSAGCSATAANAPLLMRMDTESAARDFDALRAGLGEDTLNMWVVSYGTRLGSMYAELFPERVRAIVLDSPMPPVLDFEGFLQAQSESFDAELARFFGWCAQASGSACPFRTADGSGASVAAAYEQLLTAADASPVVANGVTLDRATIDSASTSMMYGPTFGWPFLGTALAELAAGNGGSMASIAVGSIDDANDDNAFSAYEDVILQDFGLPADIATPTTYRAWAETQVAAAPHLGLQNATAQSFALDWPTAVPAQPAIGATAAPPLLITGTRHDPATPYPNALALQAAFANGSYLVTYEGDGHGNGGAQSCLGDVSAAFLVDPATPPATTDCAERDPTVVPATRPPFRLGVRPRIVRR